MCEACADVFCAWLENGMSAGNEAPDNLVVDIAEGALGTLCQTQREVYE
jgi:hypothetical protein